MAAEKNNAAAEIIGAIASLTWPVIIAVVFWYFRNEIRALLQRLSQIKKGKLFGQEFELDEKLDQFKRVTDKIQAEVAAIPLPLSISSQEEPAETLEKQLLREADRSPKITLMLLAAELERRLRQLLAATGWQQNIKAAPLSKAIEQLRAQGSLPEHVSGSVKLFQEIRNRIIHGGQATDEEIFRAIDSGFTLLRSLESIPAEINIVHRTGVPLYSDQNCSQLIQDASGIILETISPGGSQKSFRIFPTTRNRFQVGKRVAWEWSPNRIWGKAWYRDAETGEQKQAWISSSEFIGRHLDDI
jgi:hypothetical protein